MVVAPPMSRRVLMGLHITEATQDPAGTLRRLFQTTPRPFEVRILIDPAPNQAGPLWQGIPTRPDVQIRVIKAPGGTPASFNRLLAEPADRYVFVESGIHPGKDWLTYLLTALDADPANGLAGPSTNRCWNEQGVAPATRATEPDVKRQAIALARRHAGTWRSMAPLHSLSDFCLAVRADVVATVGLADTAYGRGPCWELDYNVRAARAGFRGVWVPASYVHRGPMPAWRAAAEPELLDLNKNSTRTGSAAEDTSPAARTCHTTPTAPATPAPSSLTGRRPRFISLHQPARQPKSQPRPNRWSAASCRHAAGPGSSPSRSTISAARTIPIAN